MIRSHLNIAFRSLVKNRFYSGINILGLALGVASCLTIVLFIQLELSYDNFHEKGDHIYRVNTEIKFGENHFINSTTNPPVAEVMRSSYPEIENSARIVTMWDQLVRRTGTEQFNKEKGLFFSDPTLLDIFSINIVTGDARKALTEPQHAAISQSLAKKYFGNEIPIGQSLEINGRGTFTVDAVFEDLPVNSHVHFQVIAAMKTIKDEAGTSFVSGNGNFHTYLLLQPGADVKDLEKKFVGLVNSHVAPQIGEVLGGDFTMEKFEANGNRWVYSLTPLTDIHLRSQLGDELEAGGDIAYVYLFGASAVLILLIACINFMNLSTARASTRAKEVGVRKVLGSYRSELVKQFLTESFLLSMLAFLAGLAITWIFFIPYFNDLAQKQLTLPSSSVGFWMTFAGAALALGLLSGIYPSFFLSAFRPAEVLKGRLSLGAKSGAVRSTLVVVQFMICIFLIIGTISVYRQLDFIQSKNIGFERNQILIVKDAHLLGDKVTAFKDEISKNSFVLATTGSGYLPVSGTWRGGDTFWKEGSNARQNIDEMVNMQLWGVDVNYVKTLGMQIKSGRDFSAEMLTDSSAVIINESAARKIGYPDPIGRKIFEFVGSSDGKVELDKSRGWTIIGVMSDFHFQSMKTAIGPLALKLDNNNGNLAFKFEASQTKALIDAVATQWKQLSNGHPLNYSFLDDDFTRMYTTEQKVGELFFAFSSLTIIIACLGLFAMISYTSELRTREIGIRKVLGASVTSIVTLLSKESTRLLIIAFVITAPLSWWFVDWWLESYQYKIPNDLWLYLSGGLAVFIVAWLTMAMQTFRAANGNPVKALKE